MLCRCAQHVRVPKLPSLGGSVAKVREDGADVELSWSMHVNPDSILSLDTEAGLANRGSSTEKPLFPQGRTWCQNGSMLSRSAGAYVCRI